MTRFYRKIYIPTVEAEKLDLGFKFASNAILSSVSEVNRIFLLDYQLPNLAAVTVVIA